MAYWISNLQCVWIFIFVMMREGDTVKIKELRVPEVTRHGAAVVLDCDYSLEDQADHAGLVVKWYLNDELRPVYQWIPGEKPPQGLGVLRNRLNLEYRASVDEHTMHRALHIPLPQADLSGEYTCVVSTFRNEDRKSKKMIVFVPEKNLRVRQGRNSLGHPSVTCSAEGAYPKPELTIRMSHEELNSTSVLARRNQDTGLYDISAVAALPDGGPTAPVEYACELRMPEVNYTVRREAIYYPGNDAVSMFIHGWLLFGLQFIIFLNKQYS